MRALVGTGKLIYTFYMYKHQSTTEQLLTRRECMGQYITASARIFLLIALGVAHIFSTQNRPEQICVAAVLAACTAFTVFMLYNMKKTGEPTRAGIGGVVVDAIVLVYMPFVWYRALGGTAVSSAYLTKTMYPFISVLLISINVLTFKPLFPLATGISATVVQAAILFYVWLDADTHFSSSLLDMADPSAVVLNFQIATILGTLLAGGLGAFVTATFRTILTEAANAARVQMNDFDEDSFEREREYERNYKQNYESGVRGTLNGADGGYESHETRDLHGTRGMNAPERYGHAASVTGGAATMAPPFSRVPSRSARAQRVAVLYASIRDFTSLTESLSPPRVFELLSVYQDEMGRIVTALGGVVDKFVGEGVLAVFGIPEPRADDVTRAVRAGIRIQSGMSSLNIRLLEKHLPPLNIDVGVHYGDAIAGSLGLHGDSEFTVIGDTVDTASRVESACKTTEKPFLFTGAVRALLPSEFVVRPVGYCKLRGKDERIELYTATSEPTVYGRAR